MIIIVVNPNLYTHIYQPCLFIDNKSGVFDNDLQSGSIRYIPQGNNSTLLVVIRFIFSYNSIKGIIIMCVRYTIIIYNQDHIMMN